MGRGCGVCGCRAGLLTVEVSLGREQRVMETRSAQRATRRGSPDRAGRATRANSHSCTAHGTPRRDQADVHSLLPGCGVQGAEGTWDGSSTACSLVCSRTWGVGS